MSSAYRRLIAGVGTVVLLVLGIQLFNTASADAHANAVVGKSVCLSNGTFTVTWTVTNDYTETETASIVSHLPSGTAIGPNDVFLDATNGKGSTQGTITQTGIPGNTASAYLKVHGAWHDGYSTDNDATLQLGGTCLPSKQPTTPTYANGKCDNFTVVKPTITIPSDSGVTYKLNGATKSQGTYPVSAGDYILTATSTTFTLTPPTSWTFHVTEVQGDCLTTSTPVNPTVTQAVCKDGSHTPTTPTIALPSTDGITYSAKPGDPYTAGQSVVVTATLKNGYKWPTALPAGWTKVDANTATTTVVLKDAPDCTETTTPTNPTVHQSVCPAGSHTASVPTLTLPGTTGIDYSVKPGSPYTAGQTVTVTATLQDGFKWGALPNGWTKVDSKTATYSLTFDAAPDCRDSVTPVNPTVHQSVCPAGSHTASSPTLTLPTTTGIDYSVNPDSGWVAGGTATVTATVKDGYKLVTVPNGWTKVSESVATTVVVFDNAPDCREVVKPTYPDVSQSVCAGHFPTNPTVTLPKDSDSIKYTIVAGPYTTSSTPLVTATAQNGYKFADTLPAGWTRVDDSTATFTITFDAAPECRADTTPENPTLTEAVCPATGTTPVAPSLTLPADSAQVSYKATPDSGWTAGGTASVTATAGSGYKFAAVLPTGWTRVSDSTATYAVTFADAPSCVLPVNPDLSQSVCAATGTTPTAPTLTLPSTTGVSYSVDTPAPYKAGQTVTVTATAGSGYQFDSGALTGWTLNADNSMATYTVTFDAAPSCVETVTPGFSNDECKSFVPTTATYTIPDTTGVDYYVDTVLTAPGTYTATDGSTISVVAKPQTGYTLVGTSSWSHQFSNTPTCTENQEAAKAIFKVQQCVTGDKLTPGTYTVPSSTGVDYLVNGSVVKAGTYTAKPGTTVTVVAQAKPGYTLSGASRWSFKFDSAKQCSDVNPVTTSRPPSHSDSAETASRGPLASTGVHSSSLLTIGAALLVVGIAITVLAGVSRRRRPEGPRH